MKGVVLAGGLGTRLKPLTDIVNKHLLPVWDKPMIFHPLELLARCGVEDVMVVVGGKSTGEILRLVGNGKQFGFSRVYYTYQDREGGIAHALQLADKFVGNDRCLVVLGDNVFGDVGHIETHVHEALNGWSKDCAHVWLAEVPNPSKYGVPVFGDDWRIVRIEEKPVAPTCKYAVTGLYLYPHTVFDKIRECSPSERGELEISEVNNIFAEDNRLRYNIHQGFWGDAGSSLEQLSWVAEQVRKSKLVQNTVGV